MGQMNGSLSMHGRLGSSPARHSPTSHHLRSSSSTSSLSLAQEPVAPATLRKDMNFVQCVTSAR